MRHRILFSTAFLAAGLAVAAPVHADYPPDPPVTTVTPTTPEQQSEANLPSTGTDNSDMLRIAGISVITGGGLFFAVRRRRTSSAS